MIRYWAFISYTRDPDGELAQELHQNLERLRIPAGTVAPDTPQALGQKWLRPICLDKSEFGAARELPEELSNRVRASRVLIVICSRAAKSSRWMDHEIACFLDSPQRENILLIAADGDLTEPHTCCPPSLANYLASAREPLWLDSTSLDSKQLAHGIAAGILNVSTDTFARRQKAAARRRLKIRAAAAAVLLILAAVIHWDLNLREHSRTFARFVPVNGVPKGVYEIDSATVARRGQSYRITTKGRWGRVIEMEAIGADGTVTPNRSVSSFGYSDNTLARSWFHRECRWRYEYEMGTGQLKTEQAFSRYGTELFKIIYDLDPDDQSTMIGRIKTIGGEHLTVPTQNASKTIRLDPEGNHIARYLSDERGRTIKHLNFWGHQYKRDPETGLRQRTIYLDRGQSPLAPPAAPLSVEYRRGPFGATSSAIFTPHDRNGIREIRYSLDAYGNVMGEHYFDDEGDPMAVLNVHGFSVSRDRQQRVSKFVYVGVDGRPVSSRKLIGACGKAYEYGEDRASGTVTYLGSDEQPVLVSTRVAGYRFSFTPVEEDGKVAARESIEFFELSRQPCRIRPWGYARQVLDYTKNGLLLEERFYDEEGHPINCVGSQRIDIRANPPEYYHRVVFDHHPRTWQEVRMTYYLVGESEPVRVEELGEDGKWTQPEPDSD